MEKKLIITHPEDSSITKKVAICNKVSGVKNFHFSAWKYRYNYIETEKYPNSAYYYFSTSGQNFVKVTKKLNYRPYRAVFVVTPENEDEAAQAPAVLTLRLLDGTTTNIDASLVEGMETPVYYDLSGRRVLNPGSGVYIVNGKKVFIK